MHVTSPRERGKPRNKRIPMGYLRRDDCADPWAGRRRLFVLIIGLAAAAVAGFVAAVPSGLQFASHGPVIDAHAGFESDCALCHKPGAVTFDWPGAKENPPPHFHAADAACAQCHHAPSHFEHANLDGKEPSCMSCHQDHAGRTADLKRTPDAGCTSCHADPSAWSAHAGIAMTNSSKAEAFTAGRHPEFAATGQGQKLHFNHAVHLSSGLGVDYAYSKLPDGHRLRVGKAADDAVQLDCSACHERSVGGSAGGDFAPVTYDRHCASCHKLSAPSYAADKAPRDKVPSFDLPHGIDGEGLRNLVIGTYSKQALDGNPSLRQALANDPKLASAFVGRPALKAESENINARAEATLKRLYDAAQACGECHLIQPSDPAAPFAPKVMKTGIPNRWWTRARFSHASHSSDCGSCHKTADGSPVAKSETADVLMPTVQSCTACHETGKSGVRSDCVLCHGYHGVGLPTGQSRHHQLTPKGGEVRR